MSSSFTIPKTRVPVWEILLALLVAGLVAAGAALASLELSVLLVLVAVGAVGTVALIRVNPVAAIIFITLIRAPAEGLVGVVAGRVGGVEVDPVDALSIAFVLGSVWWLIEQVRKGSHPLNVRLVKPALLFGLITGFSLLYSPGFIVGAKDLGKLAAVFAAYMVLQIARPRAAQLRSILWMVVLSAPFTILYGWYQFFAGIGLNFEQKAGLRIQSVFSHPNTYGLYLVAVLVACWGLAGQYRGKKRFIAWVIAAAALTALPLPLSRTAWLALGMVVLVVGYKHRWVWGTTVAAAVGVAVFMPRTVQRVLEVTESTQPYTGGASSLDIRLSYWSKGWELWMEKPFTGQGWGAFEQITGAYSHNDYLRMLTETSFLGLIAFVALLWILVKSAYGWTKGRKDFPLAFFGLALSYPIVAAVTNSFEKAPYQWYFWVLAGAAAMWAESVPATRRPSRSKIAQLFRGRRYRYQEAPALSPPE